MSLVKIWIDFVDPQTWCDFLIGGLWEDYSGDLSGPALTFSLSEYTDAIPVIPSETIYVRPRLQSHSESISRLNFKSQCGAGQSETRLALGFGACRERLRPHQSRRRFLSLYLVLFCQKRSARPCFSLHIVVIANSSARAFLCLLCLNSHPSRVAGLISLSRMDQEWTLSRCFYIIAYSHSAPVLLHRRANLRMILISHSTMAIQDNG